MQATVARTGKQGALPVERHIARAALGRFIHALAYILHVPGNVVTVNTSIYNPLHGVVWNRLWQGIVPEVYLREALIYLLSVSSDPLWACQAADGVVDYWESVEENWS